MSSARIGKIKIYEFCKVIKKTVPARVSVLTSAVFLYLLFHNLKKDTKKKAF